MLWYYDSYGFSKMSILSVKPQLTIHTCTLKLVFKYLGAAISVRIVYIVVKYFVCGYHGLYELYGFLANVVNLYENYINMVN